MGAVFINYRRDDTAGEARALYKDLVASLGADSVFMDVDNIALGQDFREALHERLESCDMMLVLIGEEWLEAKGGSGQLRLDDPGDFVRQEIAAALQRNIPVTPVLLQGARMPSAQQLPEELKSFAFRNGFELRHQRWESDVQEMVTRLGLGAGEDSAAEAVSVAPESKQRSWLPFAGATAVAIAVVVGGLQYFNGTGEQAESQAPVEAVSPEVRSAEVPRPGSDQASVSTGPGSEGDSEPVLEDPLIEVPSLAGMTEEAAREVLEAAGLVAGEVSTSVVWDFDGTVVDQMPADGQSTASGSAVNLVIADSAIVYVARLLANASDGEDIDATVTFEVKLIKASNTVEPVGQFTVRNVTARGLGPDISGLIDELRGEPGYILLDGVDTASLESVWRAYEKLGQNVAYEVRVDTIGDSPSFGSLGPAIMLAMAGNEILFELRAIFALAEGGFERVETGFELQAADGQFMSAIRAEGPATVSDAGRTHRLDVVRRAASDDTFTRVGSVAYDAADGMLNSLNILFQVTDDGTVYRLDVDRQ